MASKTKENQRDVFKVSNYKCWTSGTLSQNVPREYSFLDKSEFKEFDLLLSFSDEYNIEMSVINFLDTLGFDANNDGYSYLRFILSTHLKEKEIPMMLKVIYERCAMNYSTTVKAVEQAIITSMKKAVKKGSFSRINTVFNMKFFFEERPTNAKFLFFVLERFIIARKHNRSVFCKFEK
ncbi:MAG: sporulation initiation factor Spo0A C-terminal domain-containing protein [Firmicutes bacterium]|nr:sporulation initiation factor Spo0A C-terminal domain-containing protein [Bacillota bacterium]MCL2255970.1 sporulation initiation factor Spo0A C-terminal domain-containing protein [Bacillota bacterium]